ncbi:MAG: hypothetical protein H6923_01425 [Alphaproteobacteria bacterium]|nr:hypothetical protein [Alphaproteobacteria bacterium]
MKRIPKFLVILGAAAALAFGLFFVAQQGTDRGVAAILESDIAKAGGRYESIDYKSSGNVLTIRGLELPATGPGDSSVAIGLLRITGANPDGLERALDPAKAAGASKTERLFGALDIEDMHISNEKRDSDFKTVMMRDATIAPPARKAEGGLTVDDLKPRTREALIADALLRLKLSVLTLDGVSVTPKDGSPATIARIAVDKYEGGAIASLEANEIAVDGADAEGEPISLTARRLRSDELDLAPLIRASGDGSLPRTARDVPLLPGWMPKLGDIVVEGIAATSPEGSVTLDRIAMTDAQYVENISVGGALELAGLHLTLDDETGAELRALGYDELALDLSYRIRYDEEAATSRIESLVLSGRDMGQIKGSAEFGNVTFYRDVVGLTLPELLRGGQVVRVLQSVRLNGLELAYSDASLARRVIAHSAEQAGVTPQAYVADLVASLRSNKETYASDPFLASAYDAVASFLENPGTLRLKVAPETPPSLAEVATAMIGSPLLATRFLNATVEDFGPDGAPAPAAPTPAATQPAETPPADAPPADAAPAEAGPAEAGAAP